MVLDEEKLVNLVEAALLVAGRPMTLNQLENLFNHEDEKPARESIRAALATLTDRYAGRGIELVEVASGFRLQASDEFSPWIANLYQEKTPRYSRALIETLVLVAYRQPITRGEIEDVRGVAVSSNIIKTLLEREWVKILGHRDAPGRPALLGTTRQFLDYFNLKSLSDLPTLSEIKDLEQIDPELAKEMALLDSQSDETEEVTLSDAEEGDNGVSETVDEDSVQEVVDSADDEDEGSALSDDESADEKSELDLTSGINMSGQIDVHLEVEDADSANDETLAPDADELVVEGEADGTAAENEEGPTMLQAVGESETLH